MEELQSTELLDREILEDARKKAYRILKTADETIKNNLAEGEKKLASVLDTLEKKYALQGRLATEEVMARLPIDKRRAKAKKIEELLNSAVKTWYEGLSRARVLELLKKELAKRLASADESVVTGEILIQIHRIERAEAQTLLQAVLPGKPCIIEEIHSASAYPEIIVETPQVRIYASIGKSVDFFLGEKRIELLEALMGKEALDQTEIDGGGL
jgi:vacuolar-type H+-ATPase subunit E/Vma4